MEETRWLSAHLRWGSILSHQESIAKTPTKNVDASVSECGFIGPDLFRRVCAGVEQILGTASHLYCARRWMRA